MIHENIPVPFRGWTVVREIGHGSFAKVYEICRDQYGIVERSAMKVISVPQDPDDIQAYLRDGYSPETLRNMYDGSRTSVLAEYQMMVRLKDCRNIVRCEDIEIVMDPDGIGSKIYIRMELLTPIREYDKLQGYSEKEIIKLCSDICNILTRCEAEGIVHRDIKPGNIMVSDQGDYKLGDFGIARSMDHTTMATRIGTMNYMAPEIYLGKKYGHTTDIYSLGLVLYWLMNNRRMPFFPQNDSEISSSSAAIAQEKRMMGTPIPRPVNGGPGIVRVVLKALAYNPGDRYQSAAEFGNEIRKCLSAKRLSEKSYDCKEEPTEECRSNAFDVQTETETLTGKNDRQSRHEAEMNRSREQYYQECGLLMRAASSIPEYEKVMNALMPLLGYKDTDKLVEECRKEINRLNEQKQLEEKRQAAGTRKKYAGIMAVAAVLCAVVVFIMTRVMIPEKACQKEMERLAQAEVGSTIQFGKYEQDNVKSNGKEPVEWIVLEKNGNALLVISKNALDCKPFNEINTDKTWEFSTLRTWLNNSFLQAAFSNSELNHIASTNVRAEKNPEYDTAAGRDTQDQVFLLSISEAEKNFLSDYERMCTCTDYAKAQGAYTGINGQCWWWLRSPGCDSSIAAYVSSFDGSVNYKGISVNYDSLCIRPAMWINLGT